MCVWGGGTKHILNSEINKMLTILHCAKNQILKQLLWPVFSNSVMIIHKLMINGCDTKQMHL